MNIIDFPLQERAENREKARVLEETLNHYRDLFRAEDEELLIYDIDISKRAEIITCNHGYWIDAQIWLPK